MTSSAASLATTLAGNAEQLEPSIARTLSQLPDGPGSASLHGQLPLVSVIVVNFNYAGYLEQAVNSVMAQTYPRYECVVVDDASTDGSAAVLDALALHYPQLRIIRRARNEGQAVASLDGLAATTGAFVHFLDADDYIEPTFLATHIAVHLSLRNPTGFTCCDMIHLYQDAVLTRCDNNISRFLASPKHKAAALDNRAGASRDVGATILPAIGDKTAYAVEPWERHWPWSATSAMVFRRDALDLFREAPGLAGIRRCMDAFFCRGINAVSGSVIVDLPLVVYRLHDANAHWKRLPLRNTITFDRAAERATTEAILRILIGHVVARCAILDKLFWQPSGYFKLLRNLARQSRDPGLGAGRLVLRNFGALSATFGLLRTAAATVGLAALFDER